MQPAVIVCIVLAVAIIAIVTRALPPILVGIGIPLILSAAGVVPAGTAYSGLGSKTILLIAGALALGDACFRTGLTDLLCSRLLHYTAKFKSEAVKLLALGLLAVILSAFLSSFGVQVALLSLIIVMSQLLRISKSRAVLVLGYAGTLGGTWSIIGTTIMVMAKNTYEQLVPGQTFGMFEMSIVTVPIGLAGLLLYCFVTSRFLPDRAGESKVQKASASEQNHYDIKKIRTVSVIFAAFLVLVALDGKTFLPAHLVAVLMMILLVATGISTVKDIVNSINWDAIFFIVGVTVLSDAMVSSGISDTIGRTLIMMIGENKNPYIILGGICFISAVLTQLISNSGAFGVILPFLPVIADSLGVDLKPLIIAASIACSCGFCLPLSAPSYMILSTEGNLRVSDWIKQGIPITVLCVLLTILAVPMFWPLY